MNCNCIEEVNKELAKQNLALDTSLRGDASPALYIGTHWKDESKKVRGKKPAIIPATNCPFCGVRSEEARAI